MDDLKSSLGARIRKLRQDKGWSQKELGSEAQVSPRFLVQVESGKANVSLDRLRDMSQALGVSITTLLSGLGPVSDDLDRIAESAALLPSQERKLLRMRLARGGRRKLALVGIRGAGKTTLGQALSQALDAPFISLDRRVESRAGMSLREIFEYHGADHYKGLCLQVLEETLLESGSAIIEAGGSLATHVPAWRLLLEQAHVVWLRASPEALLERVRAQGDTRPMEGWADPLQAIRRIEEARRPSYALAHQRVNTEERDLEASIQAILEELHMDS